VAGGLLGTLCGVLACRAAGADLSLVHHSYLLSVVLAVLVAALLGWCFGVYPARRAAQLDPWRLFVMNDRLRLMVAGVPRGSRSPGALIRALPMRMGSSSR